MSEFKDIKQRILKQLSQLFPSIGNRPDIKKSPSLRPLYKVIPCSPIPPKIFKDAFDSINGESEKQNQMNLVTVYQTLRKVEQYLTGCINIIQHNEKVRQKYELIIINDQEEIKCESKQVDQLIRVSHNAKSKSEFSQLIRQKGQRILLIDNESVRKSFLQKQDKKSIRAQQPGQLYLPAHPDQFQFITVVNQDQYLVYHQQVLQKLLIQLTKLNKLNQQLNKFNQQLNKPNQQLNKPNQQLTIKTSVFSQKFYLQSAKQLLNEFLKDEMFCVQDNKFNKLIKFTLQQVHTVVSIKQSSKNILIRNKDQLKESFLRLYYLQFMARNQLQVIDTHIKNIVKTNKSFLQPQQKQNNDQQQQQKQINLKKITKQLQDITHLNKQINTIFTYLCHKQQRIFPTLFKRKLKKFIITHKHTQQSLHLAYKINKALLQLTKSKQSNFIVSQMTPRESNQKSIKNQQKSIRFSNKQNIMNNINSQVQLLKTNLQSLKINMMQLDKFNGQNDHPQYFVSSFTKLYHQIQQNQLKLSQITPNKQKLTLENDDNNSSIQQINLLKQQILKIQSQLIEKFKTKNKNNQLKFYKNQQLNNNNNFFIDEDKQSVISGLSSKSSIFQPYHIDQSDVILSKPTKLDQSYLPELGIQQLIKTANDFITNQFLKNQLLFQQLQDAKNINFQMINCLICQLDKNISNSNLNIQKQSQPLSPTKTKGKESSLPQKGKKSRQKVMQKSPKKVHIKKQISPSKQQQLKKQQEITTQLLLNLKDKLIFISQILCPQISQCKIPKIFEQTLQTQIFQKIFSILMNYKQKIFTQKVYLIANKYGFMRFLQQRVSFINTLIKNQKQLLQIFKFIKVFSEQKVKFQSTDEKTFEIILKALLASKQIQAYRRQNADLGKSKKLSPNAVKMLNQQIFLPFILMFKNLLKIVSSQQSTVKELEQMLENVRKSIQIKQNVKLFLQQQNQNKVNIESLIDKIQKIVNQISTLKRYPILKYSKLQSIYKFLRSSLSLQLNTQNQNRKQVITTYLKKQLFQIQNPKSQPLQS